MKSSIMESDAKIANLPIDGGGLYNFNKQCFIDYRKGIYKKEDIYNLYNALSGNDDALTNL